MHPRVQATVKLLRGHEDGIRRVIELGVGDGSILSEVINALNINAEAYGVDINEGLLEAARSRGIRVAKCDLNNCILPYGDGYFDLVLMEEVIEHLVNPDNALREAHRVLRHGGLFVVTTPNLAWWVNRIVLMLGYQPYWTEVSTMFNVGKFHRRIDEPLSGHLRLYTFRSLRYLLKLHGFMVIKALGVAYKAGKPFMVYMLDRLSGLRPSLAEVIAILAMKP
jgi:methionine biosynthesis protein MetW